LKQLAGAAVVVVAIVGMKVHAKSEAKSEARQALAELCEGDSECLAAVDEHFDECFGKAFDLGGRRRAASLDLEEMVECLNDRSGVEWFGYDPDGG
jgi:hypothetical protein